MENISQIIEIALLLLIAFLIGCVIGWFLRAKIFRPSGGASPAPSDSGGQKLQMSVVSEPAPKIAQNLARPKTLPKPREGGKNDLKRIKGVGPKIEQKLNELGIYHFDQIAAWDSQTVDWVDDYLSFKGRIKRDRWIDQAKELAKK